MPSLCTFQIRNIWKAVRASSSMFLPSTSEKRKLALKMGRRRKDIRKDYTTYRQLCKRAGKKANRNFAKIYWETGLFMLQKYGKDVMVPARELERLQRFGKRYGLKDIRKANIMKFGHTFKIIDAERK